LPLSIRSGRTGLAAAERQTQIVIASAKAAVGRSDPSLRPRLDQDRRRRVGDPAELSAAHWASNHAKVIISGGPDRCRCGSPSSRA